MTLTLYDTLTRRKEPFRPIDPANVRMYVCGPTVYDLAHIGNARPVIVFDVLFRLLRHVYGPEHVTYVRNITDIDDKINKRAAEAGVPIRELTDKTTAVYQKDMADLGNLPPSHEPRATETIPQIIAMIGVLIAGGHAYEAEGHVLFNVPSMPDYGSFSRRPLEEMISGARVDVAPYKKNPMDFVLWKPSDENLPGWDSPWGRGRPGWHIECSAMSEMLLGETFDIHGGGADLLFPHHENEIAQSVCAHGGKKLANYWLHNGMLELKGEKMAKSVGNVVTAHGLLELWPAEAIRLAMLMSYYRQPMSWTERTLQEARRTLDHWYELTAEAPDGAPLCADVLEALEDDLNTPQAIAALHALRSEAAKGAKPAAACLKSSARLMGLLQASPVAWKAWRPASAAIDDQKVETLIAARNAARKAKDFKEADRIRDELATMGIQLKDAKDPATGEIKTTWEVRASGAPEVKR
jgi:cysteinyl-tRNA synthetase